VEIGRGNLRHRLQIASRVVLPLAVTALPLVLLFSSLRTFREIDEQRAIYLRHRVGLLAARLENLSDTASSEALVETLSQDEPYLVDLRVIARGPGDDAPALAPLWDGRELFRTETVREQGGDVFRAYIPFHSGAELRIARVDLDPAAADFLVVHARHNVIVASVGGLVLVLLSVYALWAMRRTARLRERQLEMEHLAHIGKMAAVLAHEIRNPLGTIKGYVQLAGERVDQPTRDLLKPAIEETQRLESLVNDLLSYGRPPQPRPRTTAWSEVAARINGHGRQLIGERPIELSVSDSVLAWQTDPELLGQALLNLTRNAIEAIPAAQPGEVRIEVRRDGKRGIGISVVDSGNGISDEAAARLFEPFFTTKAFGTGLGLAITRKIAVSLGGTLELRRCTEGGTEALMRFPKAQVTEE